MYSHISVSPTFTHANPVSPKFSPAPSLTTPACNTSPERMKKVSMVAFALYLASREVGKNNAWRTVFWSE